MPGFLTQRRALLFALLFALSVAQLVAGLAVAGQIGSLFQSLGSDRGIDSAALTFLLCLALPVFLSEVGRRWTTEALGLDFARSVRMALFEHMLRRPAAGQEKRSRGGQILPFVGDLSALRLWWSDGIARGSSAGLIALGVCGWLLVLDWQAGIAIALLLAASLLVMLASVRPFARAVKTQRQRRGGLVALISDRVAEPGAVHALGGLRRELSLATKRNRRMDTASLRRASWSGLMRGTTGSFSVIAVAVLLAIAGNRNLELHSLVEIMAMTGILAGALSDIGRAVELAVPARIARAQIAARFADGARLPATAARVRKSAGNTLLELQGFALDQNGPLFSTKVRRGDVVLVDCANGVSTRELFTSLSGLSDPACGNVMQSGRPATGLSQRRRRERIGIAAPWLPLLRGDVLSNAEYRLRGDSGPELPEIAEALLISELMAANPVVQAGESSISPHEIAGLRLLRAVAGQPALLLLEDADRDLMPEQISALAGIIGQWRGAVILTAGSELIRSKANRVWSLTRGHITETQACHSPRLAFAREE